MRKAVLFFISVAVLALSGAANQHPTVAELQAATERWRTAVRQGDAEGILAMYTPDAQLIVPGQVLSGHDAIRAHIAFAVGAGLRDFKLEEQEIFPGDGMAVETGQVTFFDASGKAMATDRYITLWKKVNGAWKVHRDMGVPVLGTRSAEAAPSSPVSFSIRQAEPYSAVVLPMTGNHNQTSAALGRVAASLERAIAGPPFGRYFNDPASVPESELKWETGFPVAAGTTTTAPFELRRFPAQTIAVAIANGPHDGTRPWPQFAQWVNAQGYQIIGPAMEVWLDGPKTEMRLPVHKP